MGDDFQKSNDIIKNIDSIIELNEKIIDFNYNSDEEYEQLEQKFKKETTIINKKDQSFLWVCTALQILRWVLGPELKIDAIKPEYSDRKDAKDEAKKENKTNSKYYNDNKSNAEKANIIKEQANAVNSIEEYAALNWATYFEQKVPYDAMIDSKETTNGIKDIEIKGLKDIGKNLSGKTHHSATYGHDPYLGFIFGVINIITYSVTFKSNLHTNRVAVKGKKILEEVGFFHAFFVTINAISKDDGKEKLTAAVARQLLHLGSDELTKMGLPFPLLGAAQQQKLLEKGWNSKELDRIFKSIKMHLKKNLTTVIIQALLSLLIQAIIFIIHHLMYDKNCDGDPNLYEVRTLKIIEVSNIIAETSNVAFVAGMTIAGVCSENNELIKKGVSKLDIGGIISAISVNLLSRKIRYEIMLDYINKEIDKSIYGKDVNVQMKIKDKDKRAKKEEVNERAIEKNTDMLYEIKKHFAKPRSEPSDNTIAEFIIHIVYSDDSNKNMANNLRKTLCENGHSATMSDYSKYTETISEKADYYIFINNPENELELEKYEQVFSEYGCKIYHFKRNICLMYDVNYNIDSDRMEFIEYYQKTTEELFERNANIEKLREEILTKKHEIEKQKKKNDFPLIDSWSGLGDKILNKMLELPTWLSLPAIPVIFGFIITYGLTGFTLIPAELTRELAESIIDDLRDSNFDKKYFYKLQQQILEIKVIEYIIKLQAKN
ncbi:MAG: hypothetical protein Q4C12_04910 [Clostridia bacterium]|nr:hypothetical protein [Clostridia bacterium]